MTFIAIVHILDDQLALKPVVITERVRFQKRDQGEGKSIRDYVAGLRKLSEFCDFGGSLQEVIRNRFVAGLTNEAIQNKLLADRELTLNTAKEHWQ